MTLSADQLELMGSELKKFATDLSLSDAQKQTLKTSMTEAYEKLQDYRKQNPNASKEDIVRKIADNRTAIRQKLVDFLSPEQLGKWDSEMAKAKEFLGQKLAA